MKDKFFLNLIPIICLAACAKAQRIQKVDLKEFFPNGTKQFVATEYDAKLAAEKEVLDNSHLFRRTINAYSDEETVGDLFGVKILSGRIVYVYYEGIADSTDLILVRSRGNIVEFTYISTFLIDTLSL